MNKLQEQAARIAELESELKTMTSAADILEAQKDAVGREFWRLREAVKARDGIIATLEAQLAAATERERAAQYQCGECGEVHETWLYAMECCADQDEAAAQPASDPESNNG